MDLVFMGTPPFAATILDALIDAGHNLLAVYTQPPRPAGRGHRLQPSPVQLLAEQHGLRAALSARGCAPEAVQAEFAALGADAAVVAAYGLILPRADAGAPRGSAASTCMPRCCRAGAAPPRSSARCSRATPRPASRSCRWTKGSTPARSCCSSALPIGPDATAAS